MGITLMLNTELREMRGLVVSSLNHPELQQSRVLKDQADATSLLNPAENAWINPFRDEQDIFGNLASIIWIRYNSF